MIHLDIELDNIDYDGLLEHYLPEITEELRREGGTFGMMLSGMGGTVAKGMIGALSQETKDALVCKLLNRNSRMIKEITEQAAQSRGVTLNVARVQASADRK